MPRIYDNIEENGDVINANQPACRAGFYTGSFNLHRWMAVADGIDRRERNEAPGDLRAGNRRLSPALTAGMRMACGSCAVWGWCRIGSSMFIVDERMSRMTTETYQEKILAGMDGLPDEVLAEIADYVYYLRRKVTMPDLYAAEVHRGMLQYTLRGGSPGFTDAP